MLSPNQCSYNYLYDDTCKTDIVQLTKTKQIKYFSIIFLFIIFWLSYIESHILK